MEATHEQRRPHIKVGNDAEEEEVTKIVHRTFLHQFYIEKINTNFKRGLTVSFRQPPMGKPLGSAGGKTFKEILL